jgi:RecQ-mediated genome instability protein 1
LTKTALFRLLASDITSTLSTNASNCFPPDLQNPSVKQCRLSGPVVVQVLQVEDMSKSRWEQIEAIEALERGEGTRGREVIRVAPTEENEDTNADTNRGGGPHKVLLQDAKGARVFGIELKTVNGLGLGMSIGAKLVLKNASVARGVVLLEPETTTMLGGKIEGLHKAWKENRKADLRAAIEANRAVEQPRS